MEIPNLKTRKEIIEERKNNGETSLEIIMDGMFGSLRNAPEYNDANKILKDAEHDIRFMDFGSMGDYINSMYDLVEHYKDLAEHYLSHLDQTKYIMDDNGYLEDID